MSEREKLKKLAEEAGAEDGFTWSYSESPAESAIVSENGCILADTTYYPLVPTGLD